MPLMTHTQNPTFLDNVLNFLVRNFALLFVGLLLVSLRNHMPHEFKLKPLDVPSHVPKKE
jgi:hypothetical protein